MTDNNPLPWLGGNQSTYISGTFPSGAFAPPNPFQSKTPKIKSLTAVKLTASNLAQVVSRMIENTHGVSVYVSRARDAIEWDTVLFEMDSWIVEDYNPNNLGLSYRRPTDEERVQYGLG